MSGGHPGGIYKAKDRDHCVSFHRAEAATHVLSVHVLVQHAVVLLLGIERVQGGDLLPGFTARGTAFLRIRALKETPDILFGQLGRMFHSFTLKDLLLLFQIYFPEF